MVKKERKDDLKPIKCMKKHQEKVKSKTM